MSSINDEVSKGLSVQIMSFGFKNGIPDNANLVFDARFLQNPYYVEELRNRTGNDLDVQEYVMKSGDGDIFLDKLEDILEFLIPQYKQAEKEELIIAIGCTGGHHRSVTVANRLKARIDKKGKYELVLVHRDINK